VVRGFPGLKRETWETQCARIGVDKDGTPGLAPADEKRVSRDGLDVDEER